MSWAPRSRPPSGTRRRWRDGGRENGVGRPVGQMLERCLWSDQLPQRHRPATVELPDHTDVAVIGAGYTGLAAARALARRGVDVTVLERYTIGWGASGRNGGFVLPGYKREPEALARRLGLDQAKRLFALSVDAVHGLEAVIAEEAIDCAYARCGAVVLAARPGHMRGLERSRRFMREALGLDAELLGPREIAAEIGSTRYHGGLVDPLAGSVQPARLVAALARAAELAGARIAEGTELRELRRDGAGFELQTSHGPLRAREVLVATNGYTGSATPDLQRRVVPIGSYLIATAPLPPDLARRLIPRDRVLSDTKNLLFYFRLSPDRRMVFGGRAAFTPTPIARSAAILVRGMREVFPELSSTPVEYAWGGQVAFTLDQLPHAGRLDGVHYALGYCGHGVAMATWLGTRMGEALAGHGTIPRLSTPFRALPLYRGRPWFLPFVGGYYRVRDWLG
jgi:glycine/D-amino acid oxidase-like deaminating enzyme